VHILIIIIATMLCFSVNAMADYLSGRKVAEELGRAGKQQEAVAAFTSLVAEAKSDFQKSDALEQAASWACALKQYDLALELAKQIPLPASSKYCRMKILLESGKYKDLIAEYKDENFEEWPESLVGNGYYSRGSAYRAAGNAEAAAKDLEKTLENIDPDGFFRIRVLNELGGVYQALGQEDKALEAHRRVVNASAYRGIYTFCQSVITASNMLIKQGKYDEALAEIKKFDPLPASGIYRTQALEIYGDIFAGQGKKDDAKAKYLEALQDKGISKNAADNLNKKISEMLNK